MPILKMGKVMPKVQGSAYRVQCYDLGSASPTNQTQKVFNLLTNTYKKGSFADNSLSGEIKHHAKCGCK